MSPLVSIIVPVYNTAEYVEECIQSILTQSYKNIELILVDDGSTDGSKSICTKYLQNANVRYIEQENQGPQASRKRGVEMANGEWIMFVDSDDYLLEDCVQDLISLTDGVDIVLGSFVGQKRLMKGPDFLTSEQYLYSLYFRKATLFPWCKLFRAELIRNCPSAFVYNYRRQEDVLMNMAIARGNHKNVAVCKKQGYVYRIHAGSLTRTLPLDLDFYYNFCNIVDTLVDGGLPEKDMRRGKIVSRVYMYIRYLEENDYQGDRNHPLVKEIRRLMNEEKIIGLSDRLVLSVSNKEAMKFCFFLRRCLAKIQQSKTYVFIRNCIKGSHN